MGAPGMALYDGGEEATLLSYSAPLNIIFPSAYIRHQR